MKKQIWKFPLKIEDKQNINMPVDSEILCVQNQNGTPCIWVLVNPDDKRKERTFEMVGTGHSVYYDMGINRKYIGTFQLHQGELVYHLFERL